MIRSRFSGVGMAVPKNCYKNEDLKKWMDTSDEWIQQRSGIRQRYWVDPETSTSDLGFEAAEKAIEASGVPKEEIDMILLATLTPDHEFPGTACFLQKKLGLPNIPAIDVRQQCTGFIYGASIADQFIRNGMIKNALVVGAETHSKGLDISTEGRDVTVLFGDGAGAAVLSATEVKDPERDSYLLSTHLHSDGRFAEELWVQAPGSGNREKERMNVAMMEQKMHYPKMNGKAVFIQAVQKMPEAIQEALNANKLAVSDIDLFVLHQANLRINQKCAEVLEIPNEKVFNTIQDYANTTAATIPIGLCEAIRQDRLQRGKLVASAAFGSGFTWASMVYRW